MPETPLGRIVGIRAEKDPKVIKEFSKEQKKIRNDWILRRNRKLMEDPANYNKYWSDSKIGLRPLSLSRKWSFSMPERREYVGCSRTNSAGNWYRQFTDS